VSWLDEIAWNADGLVPVIAYEKNSQQILTLAWMNQDALNATVDEQRAVYWSRSRQRLWRKGEESGHIQKIEEIRLDCDSDAIVLIVEQIGGIACHTGRAHCFYKRLIDGEWVTVEKVLRDPKEIYS
jgi:phosphoribosyl-AMP cyclohydrolase